MKTSITPAMLRAAADLLSSGTRSYDGEEYICHAFGIVCGLNTARLMELSALLDSCGIENLEGSLYRWRRSAAWERNYDRTAMPVRFMFLEFIALYLEGETP